MKLLVKTSVFAAMTLCFEIGAANAIDVNAVPSTDGTDSVVGEAVSPRLCATTRRIPGRPRRAIPCWEPGSASLDQSDVGSRTMTSRWDVVRNVGVTSDLRRPWKGHNPLKGDIPFKGDNRFFNVQLTSATTVTPERSSSTHVTSVRQRTAARISLYKGQTVWKPPDWEFRLSPVVHVAAWDGDLQEGRSQRDAHLTMTSAFYDRELRVVSERYDFDRIRVGLQPFTTDPRGLLLQGPVAGIRWYGNRDNNRWQYNVGVFAQFEHNSDVGLVDLDDGVRGNVLGVVNLYRQDFITPGLTGELLWLHDRHERITHRLDQSGRQERPVRLYGGGEVGAYRVTYLGGGLDGHIGRLNLTSLIALSRGKVVVDAVEQTVHGHFGVLEASMNVGWWRPRLTMLNASGDDDIDDGRATGFDSVSSGALLSAMTHSAWRKLTIRQRDQILSGRDNLLPTLQGSSLSTFTNPGLRMAGIGADGDISPTLVASFSINQLMFDQTGALRGQDGGDVDREIGTDVSLAVTYRPHFNQQFLISGAVGVLRLGGGARQLIDQQGEHPGYATFRVTLRY
ncbi:MAG: hypothetical protein AAF525_07055 [Pseudomonadota bacterium]